MKIKNIIKSDSMGLVARQVNVFITKPDMVTEIAQFVFYPYSENSNEFFDNFTKYGDKKVFCISAHDKCVLNLYAC